MINTLIQTEPMQQKLPSFSLCVCICNECTFEYTCLRVWSMHVCMCGVCVYRGPKLTLGLFLNCLLPYKLKQALSLELRAH